MTPHQLCRRTALIMLVDGRIYGKNDKKHRILEGGSLFIVCGIEGVR